MVSILQTILTLSNTIIDLTKFSNNFFDFTKSKGLEIDAVVTCDFDRDIKGKLRSPYSSSPSASASISSKTSWTSAITISKTSLRTQTMMAEEQRHTQLMGFMAEFRKSMESNWQKTNVKLDTKFDELNVEIKDNKNRLDKNEDNSSNTNDVIERMNRRLEKIEI